MIKKIFIIVPSAVDASPIKGAAALANALSESLAVTFVTLKIGDKDFDLLNNNIARISLAKYKWYTKFKELRKVLIRSGNKNTIATISSSFSADMINSLCNKYAITCASVRGNLPITYMHTYGILGKVLAYIHLRRLNSMRCVVSMTSIMAKQVEKYINQKSPVIGNFIDEERLRIYRKKQRSEGVFRFVFAGSFIHGKQPQLLIQAISILHQQGVKVCLDMFGDGVLLKKMKNKVIELKIQDFVYFHGYVHEPFSFIANADVLVLPSLSEGVSRSVLEAMYLGVPCVLRNVDGASELIKEGENGYLFDNNSELSKVMLSAAELARKQQYPLVSLLPSAYRQSFAAQAYLDFVEEKL